MKKNNNGPLALVWSFFASVKLALFTFFVLAITSIVGTIIPQKSPAEQYIQQYGESTARLFDLLNITDMYHSVWFLGLLTVFSINLIVCSWERLPNVWRLVVMDNLATDPARLQKMASRSEFPVVGDLASVASKTEQLMDEAGWKVRKSENESSTLFFSQKGAWTRLGVYVVHVSVLVIFVGAIIGALFGWKGSLMLPEGNVSGIAYPWEGKETIPLGFEIRCDRFDLTYYDTGAPKDYRSELTVLENGQEVLKKVIEVNDPLEYKGITFYQSSYQAYDDYWITLQDQTTNQQKKFRVTPGRQVSWPQAGVSFGIVTVQGPDSIGRYRLKIWFNDKSGKPSQFWLNSETTVSVERPDTTYAVSSKQLYATGMQIAMDPGVWPVYIGCTLMLLGLIVAFFLSHQRIWIYVSKDEDDQVKLLIAGVSNKNKVGFENNFDALVEKFQEIEIKQPTKE